MKYQIFTMVCAGLLLCGCNSAPRSGAPDARVLRDLQAVRLDPAQATAMLNAYRRGQGLGPVRLEAGLVAAAQRQADAMVAANTLSHNLNGSLSQRLAGAGVAEAGENIGGGYYSFAEALAGWEGSPEHDANLRLAGVTRFGVGMAKDARTEFKVYWAMIVAAPAPGGESAEALLTAAPTR